ncbi:RDD family protein [Actinomadura sp. B10D3]|uniref:RDD family protein n=1 Tax=Actinomadura sp. B10D3 TaxID=3153557 RepID=UPI00325E3025
MIAHHLDRYPFPIAYPALLFDRADGAADSLEKAGHFVEMTAATLGILALGWCRAHTLAPGGVRQWEKKLDQGGVTLDVWNQAIRAAGREMKSREHDPVARAIRLTAEPAVKAIDTYRDIRNKYAHGGKPRLHADQKAAARELELGVSAILDSAGPLTHLQIGHIRSCLRRGDSFLTQVEVLTGYAEPFKVKRLTTAVQYEPGATIGFHSNSLEHAVRLAPYCTWSRCPACGREELFYLHQRKKERSLYFSFSTGHEMVIKGDVIRKADQPAAALGMPPISSVKAAASSGWRATWSDVAPRSRRIAARLVDLVPAVALALLGWMAGKGVGLPLWGTATSAALLGCLYEPLAELNGGTMGKQLVKIEPISTWTSRTLSRGDLLRRAIFVNLQLLFPPLAVRNLAWILWDPARQCLHDRKAKSIVVTGRSQPGQKM